MDTGTSLRGLLLLNRMLFAAFWCSFLFLVRFSDRLIRNSARLILLTLWCSSRDASSIPGELVVDFQLFQPVSLLFLFCEKACNTRFSLCIGLLGVLIAAENFSRRLERPIAISMLECFAVHRITFHNVYVELSAKK